LQHNEPACLTCQFARKWLWQTDYPHPDNNFELSKESIALCHQIRTIDKKRMAQKYGHISDTNIQIDIIAMNLRLNGTGDDWNKIIMKFSCLSFIT